jgi:hypothetical protein
MGIVAACRRLASTAAVFFGPQGAVSHLARQRCVSRQTLYRAADAVVEAVVGTAAQQRLDALTRRLEQAQQQIAALTARLAAAVEVGAEQQAEFASVAQAEGVSLPVARRLLVVLLGTRTPSVAHLGRVAQQASRRATALLEVLDAAARPLARQVAADEIFTGQRPILMTVEPESLCWLGGRLAARRDGDAWAQELGPLPALEQVSRDAGTGLANGLARLNAARRGRGLARVADQLDHFHLLREGTRALRRLRGQAVRALEQAERAQKELDQRARQGRRRWGRATYVARRWRAAEQALDRWSAGERAWQQLRAALPLFRADGELNTPAHAQAAVRAVLPQLGGPEWAKTRRYLSCPQLFTFLPRVHDQLAALPVAPELRQAALRSEGLRRQPAALRGDSPAAAARRGVLLVAAVRLAQAAAAGIQAQALVRGVLAQAWRASSAVEGLNSVLRMQQARHRRLTQGLLDLKRLYWNCRTLRTGKRKGQTPYGRLGLTLPAVTWWQLLKIPPE